MPGHPDFSEGRSGPTDIKGAFSGSSAAERRVPLGPIRSIHNPRLDADIAIQPQHSLPADRLSGVSRMAADEPPGGDSAPKDDVPQVPTHVVATDRPEHPTQTGVNLSDRDEKELFPGWLRPDADANPLIVNGRSYREVKNGLLIPTGYFPEGTRAISIGEGLSDFAKRLHDEEGVDIMAADPLYQGAGLLQRDREAIHAALRSRLGRRAEYDPSFQQDPNSIPLPDTTRIVAGDIHHLPFRGGSFTRILTSSVFQHVDYAEALPELTRVLAREGEIRTGGVNSWLDLQEGAMLDIGPGYDSSVSTLPNGKLRRTLDYVADNPELRAYSVAYLMPRTDHSGHNYGSQILIIRNDDQIPVTSSYRPYDHPGVGPAFGSVMRIDARSVEDTPSGVSIWKLEPTRE